jgi:hypothetical protein
LVSLMDRAYGRKAKMASGLRLCVNPFRLCHTAVTSRYDDRHVIERTAGLLDIERQFT